MRPDVVERPRVLKLLERGARRQPHPERAAGHRRERFGRRDPAMIRHLAALERDRRPRGQRRREEPGIEASSQRRRGYPAREGHEQVGSKPQAEVRGQRAELRLTRDQRRPSGSRRPAGHRTARRCRVREQHAGLLEELPDRGDVRRERRLGVQVATERRRGLLGGDNRPCRQIRRSVRVVHPAAREDVYVRRERHGGRAARQQHLQAGRALTSEHDGRRQARDHRSGGHPLASSSARSASGVITGSRHTKPRQTYAVGRPSMAMRSCRSGMPEVPGSAAAAITCDGR